MRWLDTITNSVDMSMSKLRKTEDRGVGHAAVLGVTKSWTSKTVVQRLNNNNNTSDGATGN